tara:strand:- start:3036 stop:4226 length:1191 start_codon:yes stop_codon:yes gene_type:complete
MENISDSHRVVTDTSDTNDSGRSIFDKGRTFLRRAGDTLERAGQSMKKVNMTHYGKSLKDVDTSEQQKAFEEFGEDADLIGRRIQDAGIVELAGGWMFFGAAPELLGGVAAQETAGWILEKTGGAAKDGAALAHTTQNSAHLVGKTIDRTEKVTEEGIHALGRGIKTAGKTIEHFGKKATEHGSDVIDNYETAVGFAGGAYDKKEDKRDNVTLQGKTYERDKEFSNQNNAVDVWKQINCEDPNDCNVYIAMKGTNIWHMKDLYYDWHIFKDSTENTDMYKEYDRITKEVFDRYGDTHKIHMTGHSKGSNVISKLSCKYHPESAITFNKGAVPWESSCKNRQTHVHNFTTGYDLISAATYFPRKKESTHFITTNKNVSLLDPAYFHNMDHFTKNKKK